jgi:Pvc16 N-terminal domain/Carboxypeptidase regulatory-like domain
LRPRKVDVTRRFFVAFSRNADALTQAGIQGRLNGLASIDRLSGTVFQDLDSTLAALLADPSAPRELKDAEKSFITPDKDYNPSKLTVNFHLHGLQENRDLHNSVPILNTVDHEFVSSAPPIRMDCTYVITAWSFQSADTKVADEHRLLGISLAWLNQFSTVPDTMLQGSLKDQMYPVSLRLAQTKPDENLALFWSALGIAPRAMYTLTATIAIQSSAPVEKLPRVEAINIQAVSAEHPTLTGRVLDQALKPVKDADITVKDVEDTDPPTTFGSTTSDPDGRFVFDGLPFGTYKLLVKAPNRPEIPETITYSATAQVHNVQLGAPS